MKKIIIIGILVLSGVLGYIILHNTNDYAEVTVETTEGPATISSEEVTEVVEEAAYPSISMDEAKAIFETPGDYIILDVRRDDEFSEGHIPGAINVPNEDITTEIVPELPDLDQTIYVYCRSGRRSKEASQKLVDIGYTNIIEFGGIIDWTGDVE